MMLVRTISTATIKITDAKALVLDSRSRIVKAITSIVPVRLDYDVV